MIANSWPTKLGLASGGSAAIRALVAHSAETWRILRSP